MSQHRRESFVESVLRRSFPSWELLLIHDGPRGRPLTDVDPRVRYIETESRVGDWGHSLRDMGIKNARGEYVLHCNADNVLLEHCLGVLFAYSLRRSRSLRVRVSDAETLDRTICPDVLVFAVRMMGVINPLPADLQIRQKGLECSQQLLLSGWPPRLMQIDAMQLVVKLSIWDSVGGWYDKSEASDGKIYQAICERFGYIVIPDILGEHW